MKDWVRTWAKIPFLELKLKLGNTHNGPSCPHFTLRTGEKGKCSWNLFIPGSSSQMFENTFLQHKGVSQEFLPGDILVLAIIIVSLEGLSAGHPALRVH